MIFYETILREVMPLLSVYYKAGIFANQAYRLYQANENENRKGVDKIEENSDDCTAVGSLSFSPCISVDMLYRRGLYGKSPEWYSGNLSGDAGVCSYSQYGLRMDSGKARIWPAQTAFLESAAEALLYSRVSSCVCSGHFSGADDCRYDAYSVSRHFRLFSAAILQYVRDQRHMGIGRSRKIFDSRGSSSECLPVDVRGGRRLRGVFILQIWKTFWVRRFYGINCFCGNRILCNRHFSFSEAGSLLEADGKMEIIPGRRAFRFILDEYKVWRHFVCAAGNRDDRSSVDFRIKNVQRRMQGMIIVFSFTDF